MPQLLEDCPGHQDVCYSEVPSALCLTARHHNLSEPEVLLRKGLAAINVSIKSCDFNEFVLSDGKKCFAERLPNGLYLTVGWKQKERDISSSCLLMNVHSLALELKMENLFSQPPLLSGFMPSSKWDPFMWSDNSLIEDSRW